MGVLRWMTVVVQLAALAAPIISVAVSFAVLWILRRRILRSLETVSSSPPGSPPPNTDGRSTLEPTSPRPIEWKLLASMASRHRSQLARLYVSGTIVLAIILAAIHAITTHDSAGSNVPRFLLAAICFGTPLIFVIRVLYGRWRPRVLVGRFKPGVVIVVLLMGGMSGSDLDPIGVALYSIPLLVLLLHDRIRAMGLLSTGFFTVLLAGTGLSLTASLAAMWPGIESRMRADPRSAEWFSIVTSGDVTRWASSEQMLSAYTTDHLLFALQRIAVFVLVGLSAAAALGALVFLLIARSYSRKHLSDQWLVIASIWFFFALAVAPHESPVGLVSNIAAVTVLGLVVTWSLPRLPRYEGPCVRLLLLRSFSLGARSERLFQELESLWRSIGSIQLIGAADLALATLEPHELLACMRGGLRREFVHRQVDVEGRLASFEYGRDPDGRFRVNEIFCAGDATWMYAVNRLVMHSDCALLDARAFTRYRAGCIFEIRTLAESTLGLPVVFLVDQVTDRDFVAETWAIGEAGRSTDALSNGSRYRFVSEQPIDGSVAERIVAAFAETQIEAEATAVS